VRAEGRSKATPLGAHSLRRFRFYEPQLGVGPWDKKVYFQTLLIAKIVEFLAHATVDLTLQYFRRDEACE